MLTYAIILIAHKMRDWLVVLVKVSVVLIKHHDQKQLLGEKGLFHLTACSQSSREVRAGTDPGAMEEYCLLVCSPWLAWFAFW